MPSAPGEGTIAEVYAAMAALEQPVFSALDSDFHAYDFFPPMDPSSLPYPFSFRLPPAWSVDDRIMGSGTDKPWEWECSVCILVGFDDPTSIGDLTSEAAQYVIPFYKLYAANRRVSNTVRKLVFAGKGVMGKITLNNVTHFGAQFPIILEQTRYFP